MDDWVIINFNEGKNIRFRRFLANSINIKNFPYRIELFWKLSGDRDYDVDFSSKVEELMVTSFEKKHEAYLIAVTEESLQMNFTWYVCNLDSFSSKLNILLSSFPPLPIKIVAMDDPAWSAYNDFSSFMNK